MAIIFCQNFSAELLSLFYNTPMIKWFFALSFYVCCMNCMCFIKTQLGDEDVNESHAASLPPSTDSRSSSAACIRKLYQKALNLSDKKVKLAEETYSLVCII